MTPENATFHSFRRSGKWYASGRGHLSYDVFGGCSTQERRERILSANGGKYPGLSTTGEEFMFVVIPDENIKHGYPLMLHPNGVE